MKGLNLRILRNQENLKILFEFFNFRSSPPEVFLGKGVLEKCSKFKGKHPSRSVISIKLQRNFIETALRHGCFPVNLVHIFRITFPKNTSGGLLMCYVSNILTDIADLEIKKKIYDTFSRVSCEFLKHIFSFKADVIKKYIFPLLSFFLRCKKEVLI